MTEIFTLRGEQIELAQLLKAAGLCGTGGEAKRMIAEKLVAVDGEPETRRHRKLTRGQRIVCVGRTIEVR